MCALSPKQTPVMVILLCAFCIFVAGWQKNRGWFSDAPVLKKHRVLCRTEHPEMGLSEAFRNE
jgi:hypothetical protein